MLFSAMIYSRPTCSTVSPVTSPTAYVRLRTGGLNGPALQKGIVAQARPRCGYPDQNPDLAPVREACLSGLPATLTTSHPNRCKNRTKKWLKRRPSPPPFFTPFRYVTCPYRKSTRISARVRTASTHSTRFSQPTQPCRPDCSIP